MSDDTSADDGRFLAFTRKYGWIVVRSAPPGYAGVYTIPANYSIRDCDVLRRHPLPGKE